MKKYLGLNVYDASIERIKWTFDNFERVYLSFSAGKDSTVMFHLVMEEAMRRNRKVGVLLIDLEGMYELTISHALDMYKKYEQWVEPYWVCLPIHLRNAVSVYQPFWKCWDTKAKDAWIRQMPDFAIKDPSFFPFFVDGMEFEEFVPEFGEWYSQGKSCACLVGIRTQESLNRFRTIASKVKERHSNLGWTSRVTEHCYNIYPIYDWKTEDIWTYHGKFTTKCHNALYDFMYKAGVPLKHQRICQPYGDDQRRGLWLFHLIEPQTWARIVARVNGANGGALYINETGNINGYRKVSKPNGHTWRSFSYLLLNSMPKKTGEHFKNKIWKFIEWWSKKGYEDGIPDEAEYHLEAQKLVPSWRRIVKSLLRNDFWCKGMGFSQQKSDAYEKYLALMKRKRENKNWV